LEKAQNISCNNIQRLYDSAVKLTSFKQSDHDMVSFVAQALSAFEKLKYFLKQICGLKET